MSSLREHAREVVEREDEAAIVDVVALAMSAPSRWAGSSGTVTPESGPVSRKGATTPRASPTRSERDMTSCELRLAARAVEPRVTQATGIRIQRRAVWRPSPGVGSLGSSSADGAGRRSVRRHCRSRRMRPPDHPPPPRRWRRGLRHSRRCAGSAGACACRGCVPVRRGGSHRGSAASAGTVAAGSRRSQRIRRREHSPGWAVPRRARVTRHERPATSNGQARSGRRKLLESM